MKIETIKQAIEKELKRRKWTVYRLGKELQGKVPMRSIYRYLRDGEDAGTETASKILQVLDLQVTSKTIS